MLSMGRIGFTLLGLFSSMAGCFLILSGEDIFIGTCMILSAAFYPLFVEEKEEEEGKCS